MKTQKRKFRIQLLVLGLATLNICNSVQNFGNQKRNKETKTKTKKQQEKKEDEEIINIQHVGMYVSATNSSNIKANVRVRERARERYRDGWMKNEREREREKETNKLRLKFVCNSINCLWIRSLSISMHKPSNEQRLLRY